MSEDGKSKGFGYIQFDSEESANDAIQKMNGSTVRDKQMYVKLFYSLLKFAIIHIYIYVVI